MPVTKEQTLYDSTYMRYSIVKSVETEVEWWLSGAGGGRNGGAVFNRYRILVLQDEKSSGDWLHNSENVLNTTELYMVNMVNFVMCILLQLLKKVWKLLVSIICFILHIFC